MTIAVAGIMRSGTTLTMAMLHAGGIACIGSPPDFERYDIGAIPWEFCEGTAVKLLDPHQQLPPRDVDLKVIRLRRDLRQQTRSIIKFGKAMGARYRSSAARKLHRSLKLDSAAIDRWVVRHECLELRFEDLLSEPLVQAEMIGAFLGGDFDVKAAASVVIPRAPECYEGFLEIDLLRRQALGRASLPGGGL